jgi:hypothetical protein
LKLKDSASGCLPMQVTALAFSIFEVGVIAALIAYVWRHEVSKLFYLRWPGLPNGALPFVYPFCVWETVRVGKRFVMKWARPGSNR